MTESVSDEARAPQEPDLKSGSRLLRLTFGAVGVAALGVLLSWWLGRAPASPAAQLLHGGSATNTLEQTPIETSERGVALKKAQTAALTHYGWVDRDAGIVRIPIERAIDMRVQEQR